jgi:hypothetical protein
MKWIQKNSKKTEVVLQHSYRWLPETRIIKIKGLDNYFLIFQDSPIELKSRRWPARIQEANTFIMEWLNARLDEVEQARQKLASCSKVKKK